MPNPTDTAHALVLKAINDARSLGILEERESTSNRHIREATERAETARAALLAHVDTLRIERDGFKELYEEWLTWAKGAVEKCKPEIPPSDSPQAQGIIDERLAHVAGVDTSEHRCKTCRYATTDVDGMVCNLTDRPFGDAANGTAIAVPGEGCGAILQVSPDFGCVRWEARKDGV